MNRAATIYLPTGAGDQVSTWIPPCSVGVPQSAGGRHSYVAKRGPSARPDWGRRRPAAGSGGVAAVLEAFAGAGGQQPAQAILGHHRDGLLGHDQPLEDVPSVTSKP